MSIKALFSHKDIFTRGGFPIFNYLKFFLKKVVRTFIKTGRGGGSKAIYKLYKKTDVLEKDVVPKMHSFQNMNNTMGSKMDGFPVREHFLSKNA